MGCPRCGGYVYAAEQMLARGRVSNDLFTKLSILRTIFQNKNQNKKRVITEDVSNVYYAIVHWILQCIVMVPIRKSIVEVRRFIQEKYRK